MTDVIGRLQAQAHPLADIDILELTVILSCLAYFVCVVWKVNHTHLPFGDLQLGSCVQSLPGLAWLGQRHAL